jgi:AcrR family transcriptional regulator
MGESGVEDKNRERIVKTAVKLFNYRGYKNATMREISKELGMSSKTIYNYFSGKEEIAEVVLQILDEKTNIITDGKADPVNRLRECFGYIKNVLTRINPLLQRDICHYAPETWEKRERGREEFITFMKGLMQEGQEMGLFKKSIDPGMTIDMFLDIFSAAADPEVLGNKGYSTDKILDFLIDVFFTGICEKH